VLSLKYPITRRSRIIRMTRSASLLLGGPPRPAKRSSAVRDRPQEEEMRLASGDILLPSCPHRAAWQASLNPFGIDNASDSAIRHNRGRILP